MDDDSNILISGTSIARSTGNSKWALVSFSAALATIGGLVGSMVFLWLGFGRIAIAMASLHLLFPVAIVCGHVALRRIRKDDSELKGMGLALLGLNVGYFNLAILAVVVWRFYYGGAGSV